MVVIDDEYIVVEGIKAIINRYELDYEVVGFAYDGIHALEVIREQKPDVVITDIRIPGLDGLSLIEAAKEFLPKTVFVVISGYMEFEYARRALYLGVKGYIDKPITIDKLTQVLKKVEQSWKETRGNSSPLSQYIDDSIHAIHNNDEEELQTHTKLFLECLQKSCQSLSEYKNESYKYLCVLLGIFWEQKKQQEREVMISLLEIEVLETYNDVFDYVNHIVSIICNKMAAGKTASSHKIVIKLLEYISENFNQDIGLNELADMVKMNPAYLSILFKEEVGMSYIKYLTQLRMDKAKSLLLEDYKVVQVSEMVGYHNYRYFCDIFKKHVNQTPNEYKGHVRKK